MMRYIYYTCEDGHLARAGEEGGGGEVAQGDARQDLHAACFCVHGAGGSGDVVSGDESTP